MKRIIICGSRTWKSYPIVESELQMAMVRLWGYTVRPQFELVTVVEGGAAGADCIGKNAAYNLGCSIETFRADWTKHGKAAGHIRNDEMARAGAALCLAFWDGKSKGTLDMIGRATRFGIPVRVVPMPVGKGDES